MNLVGEMVVVVMMVSLEQKVKQVKRETGEALELGAQRLARRTK